MNITRSFNFWVTENTFFSSAGSRLLRSHIHTDHLKNNTHLRLFFFLIKKKTFGYNPFFLESLGEAETISSTQIQSVTNQKISDLSEKSTVPKIHNQNLYTEKKVISLHSNVQQIISHVFLYDWNDTCITPLTSSRGSSVSWGRELDSRPTMKGVGVQTMSSIAEGSTGM